MSSLELIEESHVVFREHAKVLYAVFEVGNTLNTQAERISCIFFAVDTAGLQNIGVNHTATENFHPTGVLAETATLTVAEVA